MIPTENVEVKPNGQLVLQRNTKDLVVQGDAVFTGDIDAENGLLKIDQISLPEDGAQSVKKIYYHPVYCIMNVTDGRDIRFQCAIINNSNVAYTTTTLLPAIKELCDLGAVININGGINTIDDQADFLPVYALYKRTTTYVIEYFDKTAASGITNVNITNATLTQVLDGVNPIN